MPSVHEPRNYDALRATERQVLAEQEFVRAGREATVRTERPEPAAERQAQAVEQPVMTHEERHEAARAALSAGLAEQVKDKKIDANERRYLMERFETSGLTPQNDAHANHEQARQSSRGLGMTDRADMVSQQAAARERLNQAIDRGAAGQGPDQAPDQSRKPPDIER